MNQVIELKWYV